MRHRRKTIRQVGLAAAVIISVPAGMASGQQLDQLLDHPIAEISLVIDGRITEDQALRALLETRVGHPLTLVAVRESVAHLMALERFLDVQVRAVSGPGGVALQYDLLLLRRITTIRFRGTAGLSDGLLRAAIGQRFGDTPPITRVPEMAQMLEGVYRDHGYLHAGVVPRTGTDTRPDRASLTLEITAGARIRIADVDLRPGQGVTEGEIQQRLDLRVGQEFDRVEAGKRISAYVDSLKSKGYFEAKVSSQFTVDPSAGTVRAVIAVDRGPLVVLMFAGDPLPPERQPDLVPIRREGSVDEDLLEDAKRNIEDYLRTQGYRDARADYTRELKDDTLTIVFTVRKGPQYRVADIRFGELASGQTGPPPTPNIRKGDLFVESKLDAEVARIAEEYRRRGFDGVKVRAEFTPGPSAGGQASEAIRILVTEGPRTLITGVTFEGNTSIPEGVLLGAIRSTEGQGFYQHQVDDDRNQILLHYVDQGYQQAIVRVVPVRSADGTRVTLNFVIVEGARILVDHILIVGNTNIATSTIERQLTIKPGDPLALSKLVESRRRVVALGLFRQVRVTDLQSSGVRRDVLVTVEEGPLTTIGYGGGIEAGRRLRRDSPESPAVERIEIAPRGFFEIGRRNLWGKNRSVNLFTRASFRQAGYATSFEEDGIVTGSAFRLSEYRVLGNYREPNALGTRSDLFVSAVAEQAIRTTYSFRRYAVVAELVHRLSPQVSVSGRYALDKTKLLEAQFQPSEVPIIDRLFPNVRLSSFSSSIYRDTRSDLIEPQSGSLLSMDGELALRAFGSEVGFAKAFVQGFVYRRIPGSQRVVFAGGARLGTAVGFAQVTVQRGPDGQPIIGPDGEPLEATVKEVPAARRFFAGGNTTVRGFVTDRLGALDTFSSDGVPKGGNAELIFNGEIRATLTNRVTAVGFMDVGNVWRRVGDIGLADLRPALGFGLRVRTPLGPLRGDVGFKLSRLTFADGSREGGYAYFVGVGQAF